MDRKSKTNLLIAAISLVGAGPFRREQPDVAEGNRLLSQGKPEQAISAYERAAKDRPTDPTIRYNRGTAKLQQGQLEEAATDLLAASQSKELRAAAFYNLGNLLFAGQKWDEAIRAYRQSLMQNPEDRRAKWNLELALRKKKEQQDQEQQKQDQQEQEQQKQEQEQQKQEQEQQKQDQQEQEQQKQEEQKQDQQEQEQQKQEEQKQDQQKQEQQKQEQQPESKDKRDEPKEQPDQAVLDALEQTDKNLQVERLRRMVRRRRVEKDW